MCFITTTKICHKLFSTVRHCVFDVLQTAFVLGYEGGVNETIFPLKIHIFYIFLREALQPIEYCYEIEMPHGRVSLRPGYASDAHL